MSPDGIGTLDVPFPLVPCAAKTYLSQQLQRRSRAREGCSDQRELEASLSVAYAQKGARGRRLTAGLGVRERLEPRAAVSVRRVCPRRHSRLDLLAVPSSSLSPAAASQEHWLSVRFHDARSGRACARKSLLGIADRLDGPMTVALRLSKGDGGRLLLPCFFRRAPYENGGGREAFLRPSFLRGAPLAIGSQACPRDAKAAGAALLR